MLTDVELVKLDEKYREKHSAEDNVRALNQEILMMIGRGLHGKKETAAHVAKKVAKRKKPIKQIKRIPMNERMDTLLLHIDAETQVADELNAKVVWTTNCVRNVLRKLEEAGSVKRVRIKRKIKGRLVGMDGYVLRGSDDAQPEQSPGDNGQNLFGPPLTPGA